MICMIWRLSVSLKLTLPVWIVCHRGDKKKGTDFSVDLVFSSTLSLLLSLSNNLAI